jgi:glycosyltransferase involved in cell wall biosynthesis
VLFRAAYAGQLRPGRELYRTRWVAADQAPARTTHEAGARIAILLATHDGERYLDAQLGSLAAQEAEHIDVYASDDASTDGTVAVLESWRSRWHKGRFEIVKGPGRGFAENFRMLMRLPQGATTHVGFCDQDDIWDTDKLTAAVGALEPAGTRPALYCSRTRLIDSDGVRALGYSPYFRRPPHFRNAIVQSIAGGNTMLLNRAAFNLVAEASRRTDFVSHDWWCYQLVSGAGGLVYYDPVAHIGYRQHNSNAVGNNLGLVAKARRLGMTLQGRFSRWNEINVRALESCADLLSEEARHTLTAFRKIREASPLQRLFMLRRAGIYRQTAFGDLSLSVAALLGKL